MNEDIDLKSIAWRACNALRGSIESSKSAQLTLALLVVKFLSDIHYDKQQHADGTAWPKSWKDVRVPPECDWSKLASLSNPTDYLESIFRSIERENPATLGGAFSDLYLDDIRDSPAQSAIRDVVSLITRVDLRPSHSTAHEIGLSFDSLLQGFSEIFGKNTGAFYVPPELSAVLAGILDPRPGEVILDPACGAGLLLARLAKRENISVVGQDWRMSELSLCKLNLFMHGIDNYHLDLSNSLSFPLRNEDGSILQADVVVSNPPFGLRDHSWNDRVDILRYDISHRRGLADYAFIAHMLEVARDITGRVAVITSLGTLFREDGYHFRRYITEENLLAGVISLPPNLFSTTRIPVAVLFLKKRKPTSDVIFVDGSEYFIVDGSINRLTEHGITLIVNTVHNFENVQGFARLTSQEEIRRNDYQLPVSRYVSHENDRINPMSLSALTQNIRRIENDLASVQNDIAAVLRDIEMESD
jgi:type I restriction enzyme M protein